MSTRESFTIGGGRDTRYAPTRVFRLEKPHESAASHGEDSRNHEREERRGAKPTRRHAYHFETTGHAPYTNGPVLDAPFAAQVIAQALDIHETGSTSARLAYRHGAQIGRAFLLDNCV